MRTEKYNKHVKVVSLALMFPQGKYTGVKSQF